MLTLINIAQVLLNLLSMVIVVQVILSMLVAFNVINLDNDFVRGLYNGLNNFVDPLYGPIRRILPSFGQLDFSPVVVLVLIRIAGIVLDHLYLSLATGAPF